MPLDCQVIMNNLNKELNLTSISCILILIRPRLGNWDFDYTTNVNEP